MADQREELARIAALTIGHYDAGAEAFWEGTRDHDVRQNIAALLRHLEGAGPFAILDLGCGPGRDLATFRGLGHEAIGVDGAARFVEMARAHSGCEVWQQNLLALALPAARFDAIFANAVRASSLIAVAESTISFNRGTASDALGPITPNARIAACRILISLSLSNRRSGSTVDFPSVVTYASPRIACNRISSFASFDSFTSSGVASFPAPPSNSNVSIAV